jgi:hypothetical protein
MISGAARVEDAIWNRIGDRVVVISNDGGATHVLNKTAAFIWDICEDGYGIDEITKQLCDRFDVSFEEARVDVTEIIEKMVQAGIMKQTNKTTGRAS